MRALDESADGFVENVVWRRSRHHWLDHCSVMPGHIVIAPYGLQGHIVGVEGDRPLQISYVVQCDERWRTRYVHLWDRGPGSIGDARYLTLKASKKGRWKLYDHEMRRWRRLELLDGVNDIDLMFTPATKLLPIRRLSLSVDESAETSAARVSYPGLDVARVSSTYTRTDEKVFQCRTLDTDDIIRVDKYGLPIECGPEWSRVGLFP